VKRLLAGLALIAALVAGAVFLADRPGSVSLVWDGWRIDTSVAVLAVAIVAVVVVVALLVRVLRGILGAPGAYLRVRRERRRAAAFPPPGSVPEGGRVR